MGVWYYKIVNMFVCYPGSFFHPLVSFRICFQEKINFLLPKNSVLPFALHYHKKDVFIYACQVFVREVNLRSTRVVLDV